MVVMGTAGSEGRVRASRWGPMGGLFLRRGAASLLAPALCSPTGAGVVLVYL